ncbi:unnamed protein product [Protopolystoma xenopodis]|uniref:Uncharacterized protein n=1 Tax=Protopolystoma xenopodis TaxID=117903 RepID=A0A3S4ZZ08_9PLAT|nr:unnamed protein product [Protopolystoma xenopodis]
MPISIGNDCPRDQHSSIVIFFGTGIPPPQCHLVPLFLGTGFPRYRRSSVWVLFGIPLSQCPLGSVFLGRDFPVSPHSSVQIFFAIGIPLSLLALVLIFLGIGIPLFRCSLVPEYFSIEFTRYRHSSIPIFFDTDFSRCSLLPVFLRTDSPLHRFFSFPDGHSYHYTSALILIDISILRSSYSFEPIISEFLVTVFLKIGIPRYGFSSVIISLCTRILLYQCSLVQVFFGSDFLLFLCSLVPLYFSNGFSQNRHSSRFSSDSVLITTGILRFGFPRYRYYSVSIFLCITIPPYGYSLELIFPGTSIPLSRSSFVLVSSVPIFLSIDIPRYRYIKYRFSLVSTSLGTGIFLAYKNKANTNH